jgi:hypothetical protein
MSLLCVRPRSHRAGVLRLNGLLVLGALVLIGFSAGAAYYSYKEPRARAALKAELDSYPTTAEGRAQTWMEFYEPQVHHRLSVFARASLEEPWIVTHTVAATDGGAPRVFGLDVGNLPQEGLLQREGLALVLTLDPVRLLGRAVLAGDSTSHVPHFTEDVPQAEADARLRMLAEWFLKDLVRALPSDIEGARFEVRTRGS